MELANPKVDRYSKEERQFIVSVMTIHKSFTTVYQKFTEKFGKPAPCYRTVKNLYEKFLRTGSVQDDLKGNVGRPRSGRSEVNIAVVDEAVRRSPGKSTKRLSLETGIPKSTVHEILSKDLKMHPYHVHVVQAITPHQMTLRVAACEIMAEMANIDESVVQRILFSDEVTFHVSGRVNLRDTIFWDDHNPRVVREHQKDSPKVNVWAGVSGSGLIGPFFFEERTINGENYLEMLQSFMLEEVPLSILRDGYFQQDGAPPHFSIPVRRFLDEHFPNRWIGRAGPIPWPAYSPDLSPLDFWLWGSVKNKVYATNVRDLNDLKTRISLAFNEVSREVCQRVMCETFRRFHLCIERNGLQVETHPEI